MALSQLTGKIISTSYLQRILLGLLSLSQNPPFTRTSYIPSLTPIIPENSADLTYDYGQRLAVTYTNDIASAWKWAEDHLDVTFTKEPSSTTVRVVGFDVESAPNLPWRKDDTYFGPATLQLAVHDHALVLQIAQEDDTVSDSGPMHDNLPFVEAILDHPSLLLAGVGMDQDMIELYRWSDRDSQRLLTVDNPLRVDIGGIGKDRARGGTAGLKRLAACFLHVNLVKTNKLAQSPWAKAPLPQKCVAYAARDASASAAVLHRLERLDPERFSPSVLKNQFYEDHASMEALGKAVTIQELSEQAASRRECKLEWKALKEKGQQLCTDEENRRFESLQETIKELAPPQPRPFETFQSLGIKV